MIIKNCNCYNTVKAKFEKSDLQINNGKIIKKDKEIISKDSEEEIFDLEGQNEFTLSYFRKSFLTLQKFILLKEIMAQ